MSVTITQRPQRTVTEDPEQVSRWNSCWHPTIFEMQREDYQIASMEENTGTGGGVMITVDDSIEDEVAIGDMIYVNDGGLYDGSYEVLDVYALSPQTVIVIDSSILTFVSPPTGFINLVRNGYFVEVKILEYSTGSAVEIDDAYPRFSPNNSGLIKADLQVYLRTLLSSISTIGYDAVNEAESGLGQKYNIQFREYWVANGEGEWSVLSDDNIHYTINGVKRTGDQYGQNFGLYVMFPADSVSPIEEGSRGKFLTMFEQPVFFTGYPFDISFIYSQEYEDSGDPLIKIEELLDVNEGYLNETSTVLNEFGGFVNRMMLEEDYDSTVKYIAMTLRNQGMDCTPSGNNLLLNGGFDDPNPASPTFYWQRQDGAGNTMVDDYTNNRCELSGVNGSEGSACYILQTGLNIDSDQVFNFSIQIEQLLQVSVTYKSNLLLYLINSDSSKMCVIQFDRRNIGTNGVWLLSSFDTGQVIKIVDTDDIYGTYDFNIPTSYWYPNSSSLTEGFYFRAVGSNAGWDDVWFDLVDVQECVLTNPAEVEDGYYDYTGAAAISETKIIEVDPVCVDNAEYFRWLNPLGGFDYWLFHTAQDVTDKTGDEKIFEPYVEDLAVASAREEVISKNTEEEMVLGAQNLTVSQVNGIRYMLRSIKVERYMGLNSDNEHTWQTVRVNTGSFLIQKTDENKSNIQLIVKLPSPYNQMQ